MRQNVGGGRKDGVDIFPCMEVVVVGLSIQLFLVMMGVQCGKGC